MIRVSESIKKIALNAAKTMNEKKLKRLDLIDAPGFFITTDENVSNNEMYLHQMEFDGVLFFLCQKT